jgi:hypothetical protein
MYTLELIRDSYPEDPRTMCDYQGTMYCEHKRYSLGDKGAQAPDLEECIWLPLYLYDHSGITMRAAPFSCPWDSGMVGYIYVTKSSIRKEYMRKRISPKLREMVIEHLLAEVEEYDHYLTGEVYGFRILDCRGYEVESCYGFYGREVAESAGNEALDWCNQNGVAE